MCSVDKTSISVQDLGGSGLFVHSLQIPVLLRFVCFPSTKLVHQVCCESHQLSYHCKLRRLTAQGPARLEARLCYHSMVQEDLDLFWVQYVFLVLNVCSPLIIPTFSQWYLNLRCRFPSSEFPPNFVCANLMPHSFLQIYRFPRFSTGHNDDDDDMFVNLLYAQQNPFGRKGEVTKTIYN